MEPELHQPAPVQRPKPVGLILIGLLAGALIIVAVLGAPGLKKTVKNTSNEVTKKGAGAFGALDFSRTSGDEKSSPTAGEALTQSTADSASPVAGEMFAPDPYYATSYKYVGPAITLNESSADVFTFDTAVISDEQDAFTRLLGLGRRELSSGEYDLDSLNLVSKDGNRRISFSPSRWMIDYSNYSSIYASDTVKSPGMPIRAEEGTVTEETALKVADVFVKDHGIGTSAYGSPSVLERLSPYDTGATVIYPLSLNGLPVYDQSGQPFGITIYVSGGGTIVSASYPRNLQMISSRYDLISNSQSILDYLTTYYGGGVRAMGIPDSIDDVSTQTTIVSLPTASNAYRVEYISNEKGTITPYFVPAISFDIPKDNQETLYMQRIVIPTIQSFYDSINTNAVPPDSGTGAVSTGSIEPAPATQVGN